jgi:hypothetical protein
VSTDIFLCLNCLQRADRRELGAKRGGEADWLHGGGGALTTWWSYLRDFLVPPLLPEHLKCPECNQALSVHNEVEEGRFAVGVCGVSGSGKTIFTIAAVTELQDRNGNDETLTLTGIGETEQRFDPLRRDFRRGVMPAKTGEVDGARWSFGWQLSYGVGKNRLEPSGSLVVLDLAGEIWGRPFHEKNELLERYLAMISGLVLMVDGAAIAKDLKIRADDAWEEGSTTAQPSESVVLEAIAQRLGHEKAAVHIAVAISKLDHIWDHPEWRELALRTDTPHNLRQGKLIELLQKSRRGNIVAAARTFGACSFFGTSSLGRKPTPADVQVSVGQRQDERKLAEPPEPLGVVEPLQWLLGQRVPRFRERFQ